MSRWEDRNGYWYSYAYDEQGRCVYTTGTDRALEYRYAYDAGNHRTVVTDSLGHDTVYQFNESFQLIAQTDPLGHTTTHTWDRYDRTLTVTDPLGHTTRYEYDDHGDVTVIVRPDGLSTRLEHNELGLVTEVTQPDGTVWRQSFDGRGNPTVLVDPVGHRTRTTYDERGGPSGITEADGTTTRIECDGAGLPIALVAPQDVAVRYAQDAFGRVTRVRDASGGETELTWSPEGHLLRRVGPAGDIRAWTFDAEGNCQTVVDENGATTTIEYGAFDLPVRRVGPDGAAYRFVRDTELRISEVIDPQGRVWHYEYDAAGRLTSQTDFDGRTTRYRTDAAGRVVAWANATGQSVRFRHDVLGRVVERTTSDGVHTRFVRDPLGRLLTAETPDAALSRSYDAAGRWLTETVNGRTLTVTRDARGEILERVTPSGVESRWTHVDGAPAELTVAGRTLTFERSADGLVRTLKVGDQCAVVRRWDVAGRVTDQTVTGRERREVWHRSFAYRADHHPVEISGSVGTTRLTLDEGGRVTRVDGPGADERYTYGDNGDLVEARWEAVPEAEGTPGHVERRPVGARRTRCERDAAGRVVERRRTTLSGTSKVWRYVWDADDRLVSVTTPEGTHWRYGYDALGRRVCKERLAADDPHVAVERTDFTWQDSQLVEQTTHRPDATATSLTWEYEGTTPLVQVEGPPDRGRPALLRHGPRPGRRARPAGGRTRRTRLGVAIHGVGRAPVFKAVPDDDAPPLPGAVRGRRDGVALQLPASLRSGDRRLRHPGPVGLGPRGQPRGVRPEPHDRIGPARPGTARWDHSGFPAADQSPGQPADACGPERRRHDHRSAAALRQPQRGHRPHAQLPGRRGRDRVLPGAERLPGTGAQDGGSTAEPGWFHSCRMAGDEADLPGDLRSDEGSRPLRAARQYAGRLPERHHSRLWKRHQKLS
ncbi:hypothetical protein EBN88_14700 [Streptomyces triticirhizae]|uniref:RHS repeat protein n=1 Tax=Streptomyces triticirhizae TaxID=2483353 RepID=A0A3M2LPX9_9ACTN|nr:hypothetical protein EBN88_14700 [Streptomyces triticirhizae]